MGKWLVARRIIVLKEGNPQRRSIMKLGDYKIIDAKNPQEAFTKYEQYYDSPVAPVVIAEYNEVNDTITLSLDRFTAIYAKEVIKKY